MVQIYCVNNGKTLEFPTGCELLDIYPAREEPIPGVGSEMIYKDVTCPEKVLLKKEELMDYLQEEPLDVLVSFGAGNIDRYIEPITELVKQRA